MVHKEYHRKQWSALISRFVPFISLNGIFKVLLRRNNWLSLHRNYRARLIHQE